MGGGRTSEFSCRSTGWECVLIIGNSNLICSVCVWSCVWVGEE